jgi:tRNA(Ile)-lysidine synthase
LAVAFSGGMDSSSLLHVITAHRSDDMFSRLSAIHVNHGLNAQADEWAEHCRRVCQSFGIPLTVVQVEVSFNTGQGLEGAARMARYKAMENINADWILLGHHQDDQAETLLLNMIRGTGITGAAAMPESRGRYLRPLLNVSRIQVQAYADSHGLSWIEDDSNFDVRFSRNYLRKMVMPVLEKEFQAISKNLARAAGLFGDADELLAALARQDVDFSQPLKLSRLRELGERRCLNVLVYYLRQHGCRVPSQVWLNEAVRQLFTARHDRHPCLKLDGYSLIRYRDEVHLVREETVSSSQVIWEGQDNVPWCNGVIHLRPVLGDGVSKQKLIASKVSFQPRLGGERFQLHAGAQPRALKDLLREADIPPWVRKTLPLMHCDQKLVWVAEIGVAAEYRATAGEPGYSIEFERASW